MDVFVVLADHYGSSTRSGDLAHSALPNAPQRPYVERKPSRHRLRALVARLRHRRGATRPEATRHVPVRSPGALPSG
jgi:hypothetical protein